MIFSRSSAAPVREQVMRVDGRWVRLVPDNLFPSSQTAGCQKVAIKSDGHGFYNLCQPFDERATVALDVTALWERKYSL